MKRLLALFVLVPATGLVASGCAFGSAHHATASKLVTLTRASPYRRCWGADMPSEDKNSGEEPYVATGHGGRLVAVWAQDFDTGVTAAISRDGGSSWNERPLPFTNCREEEFVSGTGDQWAAVGPDGRIYVAALADFDTGVAVTTSSDWGRRWTAVRSVPYGNQVDQVDKPTIAADAKKPGEAYVVFSTFSKKRHMYWAVFSRSTDGGNSWTDPIAIARRRITVTKREGLAELVVDPRTDRLYAAISFPKFWGQDGFTMLTSSGDSGRTWSHPRRIFKDDSSGIHPGFRVGSDTRIAVDPSNGTLYAAWMDASFRNDSFDDILLSRSTDRGLHWSMPTQVTRGPGGGFTPSITVNADGLLGLTYYAPRQNPLYLDSSDFPISYWFVNSSDGGRHFSRPLRLARPFNFGDAPRPEFDYFIGDYEGLAAAGNSFHPVFVVMRKGKASPNVVTMTIQP